MRNSAVLLLVCFSMLPFSCSTFEDVFGVGSNVHSEAYTINSSEGEVLDAVSIFKIEHPEYCPPNKEDADYYSDPFHRVFFYYTEKKTLVIGFVRGENNKTTFGLNAIRVDGGDARSVNSEIKGSENDAVIREFEERILNPIKEILGRN